MSIPVDRVSHLGEKKLSLKILCEAHSGEVSRSGALEIRDRLPEWFVDFQSFHTRTS